MYWNHRVMRRVENDEEMLFIVEVYYESGTDKIFGWTEKEEVWGKDLDGLRQSLEWMTVCLEHPVLDEAELLAQAEEARANGESDIFVVEDEGPPAEGLLTFGELLESLGLEREDVEPDDGCS